MELSPVVYSSTLSNIEASGLNDFEIEFTDANLHKLVAEEINKGSEDKLFFQEVQGIEELNGNTRSIQNLTGLNYLTHLKQLDLGNNRINDISALSNLKELKGLYLNRNAISDLTPLVNLAELEILSLDENDITSIDPLKNLSNLKILYLSNNQQLENMGALRVLDQLESLSLDNTMVGDFKLLKGLKRLKRLHFSYNGNIRNFGDVINLKELEYLSLNGNEIDDIRALAGLEKLCELHLLDNEITDVSPLAKLKGLKILFIRGNNIKDYRPIAELYKDLNFKDFIIVEDVDFDKKSIELKTGDKVLLKVNVIPEDASNRTVKWRFDPKFIEVTEDGLLTAIKTGNTVVTVISEDGSYEEKCTVNVKYFVDWNQIIINIAVGVIAGLFVFNFTSKRYKKKMKSTSND